MSNSDIFINSMPVQLQNLLSKVIKITEIRDDTPSLSAAVIDHTSLADSDAPMIGVETDADIQALCDKAKDKTAAVCVYPNHIKGAKSALDGSTTQVAAVNNFPHGTAKANDAANDVIISAVLKVDEIDTVLDYQAFLNGDIDTAREKLNAVSSACKKSNIALKTILKASVYKDYQSLYNAAILACETGADFVKTCTGKMPIDGYGDGQADASILPTGLTVMQAVADYNKINDKMIGVKISGGVKTALDCEKYRTLVDELFGKDYFQPKYFRFGASSLLANLQTGTIDTGGY